MRTVGGASRSSSPRWSSERILGVCGNRPAPAMTAGSQGFDSELCVSYASGPQQEKTFEIKGP